MNFTPEWKIRAELRKRKGRSFCRETFMQWDQGRGQLVNMGATPDPILDLYSARLFAVRGGPRENVRYGEIRQRVVSPIGRLP